MLFMLFISVCGGGDFCGIVFCGVEGLVWAYVVMMRSVIIIVCIWLVEGVVFLYLIVYEKDLIPNVTILNTSAYPLFICNKVVHSRCTSIVHEYAMCMLFM